MELILVILLSPFAIILSLIFVCDGECYYCGARLKKPTIRKENKKWCGCSDDNSHSN